VDTQNTNANVKSKLATICFRKHMMMVSVMGKN